MCFLLFFRGFVSDLFDFICCLHDIQDRGMGGLDVLELFRMIVAYFCQLIQLVYTGIEGNDIVSRLFIDDFIQGNLGVVFKSRQP